MLGKFLNTIRFSELTGYWKNPKPDKLLSEFIRLNVICSFYGQICRSEEFYEKEKSAEFESFLAEQGWRVIGNSIYCPSCYQRELDR